MKSLTKEIFIIALLLMIVVFMIGMVFYNYMPNNKLIPEPISYSADSKTTAILQEISMSSSDTDSDGAESQSVIKSYSIGQKDLSTAASKQSYTSGKTNPFAEYKEEPAGNNTEENPTASGGNNTGNNTNNNTTTNANTTKHENSSSTGTFFENKNSK